MHKYFNRVLITMDEELLWMIIGIVITVVILVIVAVVIVNYFPDIWNLKLGK